MMDLLENRLEKLIDRYDRYLNLLEGLHDHRSVGVFAIGLMMKEIKKLLLTERLEFTNPEWIVTLAEDLSSRLFDAIDAFNRKTTDGYLSHDQMHDDSVWNYVFESIKGEKAYIYEDLSFMLYAHIAHDLPLSLRSVGMNYSDGILVGDYHKLNAVLAKNIDLIQSSVAQRYQPRLSRLFDLMGVHDELVSNYGIRVARGMAWYNACRLMNSIDNKIVTDSIRKSVITHIKTFQSPSNVMVWMFVKIVRLIFPRKRIGLNNK